MKPWKFSRSHIEAFKECPRLGYLRYYYNGTGIVKKGVDLYQSTGSLIHHMMELIMGHCMLTGYPDIISTNTYIKAALARYRDEINEKGFTDLTGDQEYELGVQAALAEGLVRVFVRDRLPIILDQYEIIAVEEEHEIPFAPGQILMSRMDCAVRRKSDGAIFAGPEFKKTAYIKEDYFEGWRYSIQTLSHGLDIEYRFGERCAGVMMEFLYTGMKKKDSETKVTTYYSPLVRAFKMSDSMGNEEYGFDSELGRKKGWTVFEPYVMGMEKWLGMIPIEYTDGMLSNMVVYRNDREMEIWKQQTAYQQATIQQGIMLLDDNITVEAADSVMAQIFPARMDKLCYSNLYHKSCPYKDVCFGVIDDPLGSGIYVAREPHHVGEFSDVEEE